MGYPRVNVQLSRTELETLRWHEYFSHLIGRTTDRSLLQPSPSAPPAGSRELFSFMSPLTRVRIAVAKRKVNLSRTCKELPDCRLRYPSMCSNPRELASLACGYLSPSSSTATTSLVKDENCKAAKVMHASLDRS
ncbi:hypothetical protein HBH56_043840 [Parastagonospora nodorum]|nr:hypothetical protein HBH56_043840 [Parastagonospora nodorum]QRC92816.1 hypothetical protein JI435_081290 [Parastagonospora nodorum SN15]KAH3933020.1 hypothetical protein HBH54_071590 [Parastagonospora nodorum]KAH3973138.1 hypothetical protein HBH52_143670 [Parastagonospora nodorum]KAH4004026.1 hypothetical protein HBI10_050600 [Parastagonospora nodorum]